MSIASPLTRPSPTSGAAHAHGVQTPVRSRAEMEALIALPGMRSACLSRGKLGLHEEFPEAVAQAIEPFLNPDAR
jgi:hypothetical protein